MRTGNWAAPLLLAGIVSVGLTACSGGSEDSATASALAAASALAGDVTGPTATAEPTTAAGLACAAYFELDLLNSSYTGGAVKDGDMSERQARADFTRYLKEFVAQAKTAVADGTADRKLLVNGRKMLNEVSSLPKGASLGSMSNKRAKAFAKQSVRVQKACERAGFPLPADNVTARAAAGLT